MNCKIWLPQAQLVFSGICFFFGCSCELLDGYFCNSVWDNFQIKVEEREMSGQRGLPSLPSMRNLLSSLLPQVVINWSIWKYIHCFFPSSSWACLCPLLWRNSCLSFVQVRSHLHLNIVLKLILMVEKVHASNTLFIRKHCRSNVLQRPECFQILQCTLGWLIRQLIIFTPVNTQSLFYIFLGSLNSFSFCHTD